MIVYGLDEASGPRPGIVLPRAGATTAPPRSGAVDAESREWRGCMRNGEDVGHEALALPYTSYGAERVLVRPVGSDPVETCSDLDVEAAERSMKLGERAAAPALAA